MARTIFIALTWALLINLSVPLDSAWGEPKRGGTLTMAIRKDLTMMNPLVRTMSTDQSIRELIYESLLTLDEKGNLKPRLAESWKISKDGKTYTFHLRKGVKYHNGQEMTARDAKFAMDYTLNPRIDASVELVRTKGFSTLMSFRMAIVRVPPRLGVSGAPSTGREKPTNKTIVKIRVRKRFMMLPPFRTDSQCLS